MDHFAPLKKELEKYLEAPAIEEVAQAYELAEEAHRKQTRRSGKPYITHPVSVALILADMHLDKESIMAAILHDVLEDTPVGKKELAYRFGDQVADLVDGVSKLTQIEFETRALAQAENFRKMVMAMVKDIRVILVKLADRLHNMRTLQSLSTKKQYRIARETLDIYAPIANRLGMHNFRVELEDLGFAAMYPMRHRVLKTALETARGNNEKMLSEIKQTLETRLEKAGLNNIKIWGREKHLYSIYKKMLLKRLSFSEIMDIYAFRVTVDTVEDCYRVLGHVHNLYKPVPERFKDYIAIPKVNSYQSLHTTLFGPYGIPIEIQIRTKDMDKMADSGITTHWLYKSEDFQQNNAQENTREWVQGLLEIQKSTGSSLEFIENVKIDLFHDDVYVFTPKGNILQLPAGSTPVDFAYAIHSDIGDACVAARINRRLTPLSTPLSNGQSVSIITAPGARPNPAWLNFVVTGKARSNIRHYIKGQYRGEAVSFGRSLLSNALMKLNTTLDDIPQTKIDEVVAYGEHDTVDDLIEQIGLGNQLAVIVARRLAGLEDITPEAPAPEKTDKPLSIKGSEGVIVSFSTCCRPIPGDPIIGLLRPGHGLDIHHEQCLKVRDIHKQPERIVPVRWEDAVQGDFMVDLYVEVMNHRGVLATLATTIAEAESNIFDISIDKRDGKHNLLLLSLMVCDRAHLATVLRRLRHLKVVTRIIRKK